MVAVGVDRVRNDYCLTVYDMKGSTEPRNRFFTGEAVTSVKFLTHDPQQIIAAVARSNLRLLDLRDPTSGNSPTNSAVFTKYIHNIAIDPLDGNYFASGGPPGEPVVSIWDRRFIHKSTNTSPDSGSQSVLELRPAVDNSQTASVWSIRYSGHKRGRFGVLSSTGAIRIYDIAEHSIPPSSRPSGVYNFYGGNSWGGSQYVSRTHELQYPFYDKVHGQEEGSRAIAFDWVGLAGEGDTDGQNVIALRLTREVNLLTAPRPKTFQMTARDDLVLCDGKSISIMQPYRRSTRVEEDVSEARRAITSINHETQVDPTTDPEWQQKPPIIDSRPLNAQTLEALKQPGASIQRTQTWLSRGGELSTLQNLKAAEFPHALTLLNVHKRRCQEGYRLDTSINKGIAKEDEGLWRLWAIISRMESLRYSQVGGMLTDTLDLSYIGVYGIWHSTFGSDKNRLRGAGKQIPTGAWEASLQQLVINHSLPTLEGLPPKTLNKRLVGLEICGWCLNRPAVEAKCSKLLESHQFERAVAVAVYQGQIDIALTMLGNLIRQGWLTSSALPVLLASGELNTEQQEMCRWMEEGTSNPYLRCIFRFLADKNWHAMAENTELLLSDRLGVALRYLNDVDLTTFLNKTTARCVANGDVSGILLTGLTGSCMPLFQNYITRTQDIQSALLVTALAHPLYIDDVRWQMWKEIYFDMLQSWKLFIERTKFSVEHAQRNVKRDGTSLVTSPPRQISLRCIHCQGNLARLDKTSISFESSASTNKSQGASAQAQKLAESSGTTCPKCARHLPRCAICMQWLGLPDVMSTSGGRNGPVLSNVKSNDTKLLNISGRKHSIGEDHEEYEGGSKQRNGNELLPTPTAAIEAALSRFVTFCANCSHSLHAHHARQWFAKHGMCPVPDCGCLCGIRR